MSKKDISIKVSPAAAMLGVVLAAGAGGLSSTPADAGVVDWLVSPAAAAEGGHDTGHSSGHDSDHGDDHAGGPGGDRGARRGQGGPGMESGGHGRGGAEGLEHDVFRGHSDESDAEGKGPKFMGGGRDRQSGGRPVWAQEGLLTDDLGRLSMSRSPQHVMDHQLAEALASYDPEAMASYYEMSAAEVAELLRTQYDTVVRIDSPGQNLALLQALLDTNPAVSPLPGVDATAADLAAIFLGTASDKEMQVTPEVAASVLYILLGKDYVNDTFTWADIDEIATKADSIRDAILTGHGE